MTKLESKLEWLFQNTVIEFIECRIGKELWTTVYSNVWEEDRHETYYSALIPNDIISDVLERYSWDYSIGDGQPGCSQYYENDKKVTEYRHFSNKGEIQPLVLRRSFYDIKPMYFEILEEFRLFHNLYHDLKNNKYIKITDGGDEEEIIILKEDEIKIKTKAIRQFMALKETHLAIFFDSVHYSHFSINDLVSEDIELINKNGNIIYMRNISEELFYAKDKRIFSRLLGKKLIPPFKKEKCGIWPFEEESEEYQNFIIGIDEEGENINYTSNPDELANNFGANPGAPHYLTSVFSDAKYLTVIMPILKNFQ